MRIGMLTGGGDCPGLNAVIRAVVRKGEGQYGHKIVGYRHGWRGVMTGESIDLTSVPCAGCSRVAARSSARRARTRTRPTTAPRRCSATLARDRIDALIAIGGEDTLGVAHKLVERRRAASSACRRRSTTTSRRTDFTFGFHTAVQIATDAIDRLHTTAESHDRVMVVEVMGRHAGWIATYSGLAGGADIILDPREPFDIEEICDRITHRHERGANFSIVVVGRRRDADGGHDGAAVGRGRRLRPRAARRRSATGSPTRSSSAPASKRG